MKESHPNYKPGIRNAWGEIAHITDGWLYWDCTVEERMEIRELADKLVQSEKDKATLSKLLSAISYQTSRDSSGAVD